MEILERLNVSNQLNLNKLVAYNELTGHKVAIKILNRKKIKA